MEQISSLCMKHHIFRTFSNQLSIFLDNVWIYDDSVSLSFYIYVCVEPWPNSAFGPRGTNGFNFNQKTCTRHHTFRMQQPHTPNQRALSSPWLSNFPLSTFAPPSPSPLTATQAQPSPLHPIHPLENCYVIYIHPHHRYLHSWLGRLLGAFGLRRSSKTGFNSISGV
jgi:hypothetical protein